MWCSALISDGEGMLSCFDIFGQGFCSWSGPLENRTHHQLCTLQVWTPLAGWQTWHPFKADLSVFILWDEEGLVLVLIYKTDSCNNPCLPEKCPHKIWSFVAYFSVVLVLASFFCHFMYKTTSQEVFWKVLYVNSKNPVNIMTSCIIQFLDLNLLPAESWN